MFRGWRQFQPYKLRLVQATYSCCRHRRQFVGITLPLSPCPSSNRDGAATTTTTDITSALAGSRTCRWSKCIPTTLMFQNRWSGRRLPSQTIGRQTSVNIVIHSSRSGLFVLCYRCIRICLYSITDILNRIIEQPEQCRAVEERWEK